MNYSDTQNPRESTESSRSIEAAIAYQETPEFLALEEQVDQLVTEEIIARRIRPWILGGCHVVWSIKKRIFKEKYQIDWLSPADLNPTWIID